MFNFFIKKNINSALANNTRTHIFRNFESMDRVLILFSIQDWDQIAHIVKDLEDKGKQVFLWTVESKKHNPIDRSGNTTSSNLRIISQKDLSWKEGLSSSVMEEFKALKYDTLLDLTTEDNKALIYLLANNQSEFCIGIKELDYKVFDFIILKENDKNLMETYNQIKFYLSNMR